jgi:hypothetical protein
MKWVEGTWTSEAWAELVKHSPWDFPYDREGYADALGQNWAALMDTGFALPLAYRKKWGMWTGYLPFGMQQWGPIGPKSASTASLCAAVEAIPGRLTKVDIAMHRPEDWQPLSSQWKRKGLRLERWTEQPNYVLDIGASYEQVYAGYSKQTIRNLKASQQSGMTVFEHDTPDVLLHAFKANQAERYAVPAGFEPAIRAAMYHLLHQGRGALWSVYGEGNRFLAGAFIAFAGNRAVLLFSAISDEGRQRQAMTYLLNEVLTYACGRWTCFDFEGSKSPGLARFYAGFGAKLEPFLRYQRWAIR